MKKKFSLFLFINFFLFILFSKVFAESNSRCNLFYKDLEKNFIQYNLDNPKRYTYNDFGFILEAKFNHDKDKWEWLKDDNGYYVVGGIISPVLIDKVEPLDVIISINGEDIRNGKINRDENIYIADFFEDGEEANFKFLRKKENEKKKIFDVKLKKIKKKLIHPELDIYFNTIDINQKTSKIDISMKLDWRYYFDETQQIYQSAKKHLFYFDNSNKLDTEQCNFSEEKWMKLNSAHDPARGMKFIDLFKSDKNLKNTYYEVAVYSNEIDEHIEDGWGNEGAINYFSEGIFTFTNNFDLKNFPFDKQKISIVLANRYWTLNESLVSVTDYSERSLTDFIKKNNISGWNIIGHTYKYEPYKGPNDNKYFDSLVFEIDIERKHDFYIYKVIIPIILILMVCWSSLWITPKELESRLTITIVCLLSLIAYNFVIDKELPKLEYLTILDWIILISYIYATIPNFISIISHNLFTSNKKFLCFKIENIGKKYGPTSYVFLVLIIIIISVNLNPDNANYLVSWMSAK